MWKLATSNVRRWHFEGLRLAKAGIPQSVTVDGQRLGQVASGSPHVYFLRDAGSGGGVWKVCAIAAPFGTVPDAVYKTTDAEWKSVERSGRQWGALDAFLGSEGLFSIVLPPGSESYTHAVALDISRNLYQYFGADTDIISTMPPSNGNVVLVGRPPPGTSCGAEAFPISISEAFVEILDGRGELRRYPAEPEMGAIFLCPLSGERLMLVVWGSDETGLRTASRLLPLRTGVGQPDFVLVGRESRWGGVGGAKALGMFDSKWRVSRASYV